MMLFHHSIQKMFVLTHNTINFILSNPFDSDMMLRQLVNFFTLSFFLSSLDILRGSKEVIILTKG